MYSVGSADSLLSRANGELVRSVHRVVPLDLNPAELEKFSTDIEQFWQTHPHMVMDMAYHAATQTVSADLSLKIPGARPEKIASIVYDVTRAHSGKFVVTESRNLYAKLNWEAGYVTSKLPKLISRFKQAVSLFMTQALENGETQKLETAIRALPAGTAVEVKLEDKPGGGTQFVLENVHLPNSAD